MNRRNLLKGGAVATLVLSLLISQIACGGADFAQTFRLALLAAPPLIESLALPASLKTGLITDFTDLGGDALDLKDCLSAAPGNPAKLMCVQTLETKAEIVIARGHFVQANNPKLQRILGLIRGIIQSAKVFYGGGTRSLTGAAQSPQQAEKTLKAKLKELKAEMNP
jgi:hypothetical protein